MRDENTVYVMLAFLTVVLIGVTIGLQLVIMSQKQIYIVEAENEVSELRADTSSDSVPLTGQLQIGSADVRNTWRYLIEQLMKLGGASSPGNPTDAANVALFSAKPFLTKPGVSSVTQSPDNGLPPYFALHNDPADTPSAGSANASTRGYAVTSRSALASSDTECGTPLISDKTKSAFVIGYVGHDRECAPEPIDSSGDWVGKQASEAPMGRTETGPIVVGSRDTTEQLILGQMMVILLEANGLHVIDQTGLDGTNSPRDALISGDVDLIWDAIGTVLSESHGISPAGISSGAANALELLRGLDGYHHDLVWLEPSAFNSTYALITIPDRLAGKSGQEIDTIDQLAAHVNRSEYTLRICVDNEFYMRDGGLDSLQNHYGFAFVEQDITVVDGDRLYTGLRDGLCDVAAALRTDGRISAWDLQILKDSSRYFPAYNASPVMRRELFDEYPQIADILNPLVGWLDTETMAALNARADIGADGVPGSGDEEDVRSVALSFLLDIDIDLTTNPGVTDRSVRAQMSSTGGEEKIDRAGSQLITAPTYFDVNAYKAADTASLVVEVLEKERTYPVIGRTSDSVWIQVQLKDGPAWVFTDGVRYSAAVINALPVVASSD